MNWSDYRSLSEFRREEGRMFKWLTGLLCKFWKIEQKSEEDGMTYGEELRARYKHLGPGWMGVHRAYVTGQLTPEDMESDEMENFVSPTLMQIALMELIANTIRELHTTKLRKLTEEIIEKTTREFYTPEMIARIRGDK